MARCAALYKRLLYQLDHETDPKFSDYYLSLLKQTQTCDHHFNLKWLREENQPREKHQMVLEHTLPWSSWFWYKSGHQLISKIPPVPYRPQPS